MLPERFFDNGPAPTGDPRIDLSKVLFVFDGKTVPGAKLAELLGTKEISMNEERQRCRDATGINWGSVRKSLEEMMSKAPRNNQSKRAARVREKRRYHTAKDIYRDCIHTASLTLEVDTFDFKTYAEASVEAADALLQALESDSQISPDRIAYVQDVD